MLWLSDTPGLTAILTFTTGIVTGMVKEVLTDSEVEEAFDNDLALFHTIGWSKDEPLLNATRTV